MHSPLSGETHSSPPEDPNRRRASWSRQFALAMELPFLLAGSIFIGGLFGHLLDRWLGTKPFLMIALGGLGLYAGVRELLRRLLKTGTGANRPSSR